MFYLSLCMRWTNSNLFITAAAKLVSMSRHVLKNGMEVKICFPEAEDDKSEEEEESDEEETALRSSE